MFETEAEKYVDNNFYDLIEEVQEVAKITFKDGAEFGYNKAKEEWKKHFMQCSSPFCLDIFSSVKCYGELGNMTKKEGEEK